MTSVPSGKNAPRIVIDLDDTLTIDDGRPYPEKRVNSEVLARLREYRARGFQVAIYTARNMRTFEQSLGKIAAFTLPVIIKWLNDNDVPFDEIYIGKPWCGEGGFYVDDKAVRPDEFVGKSYDELLALVGASAPQ